VELEIDTGREDRGYPNANELPRILPAREPEVYRQQKAEESKYDRVMFVEEFHDKVFG